MSLCIIIIIIEFYILIRAITITIIIFGIICGYLFLIFQISNSKHGHIKFTMTKYRMG